MDLGHGILVQLAHCTLTALERRRENHLLLDVIPKNIASIQCILKTIVQVATQLLLVLANKLQAVLFSTCIHVNNELLQKPSDSQNPFLVDTMLQHVHVKLKHGDAHGTTFTTYCILIIVDEPKAIPLNGFQWDVVMPSVASIWEEKDIVQWCVCTMQGRDALKVAINQMHDNVACICFIHITPNHQCIDFINSWCIAMS